MTRRRLKLKSPVQTGGKAYADASDLGRRIRVRPLNLYGRCWWVTIYEISESGALLNVGVSQEPKDWPSPVPAKRQNRGFGRRRWVLTSEVVTWKRKESP